MGDTLKLRVNGTSTVRVLVAVPPPVAVAVRVRTVGCGAYWDYVDELPEVVTDPRPRIVARAGEIVIDAALQLPKPWWLSGRHSLRWESR